MPGSADSASTVETLLHELGVVLDPQLFELACTHRSYAYEHGGLPTNERLEFLGDSVLGIVVTEHVYHTYPQMSEGELAKLRAAVVSTQALARVARTLHVGSLLKLGRGELTTGGRDKDSLLADAMEAIIGAIHVQHGIEGARRWVHHILDPVIAQAVRLGAGRDWKTALQELAAERGDDPPRYDITSTGPDHDKRFTAQAMLGSHSYGTGTGRSKKVAEQIAAEVAYRFLKGADATLHGSPPWGSGHAAGKAAASGKDGPRA